MDIGIEQRVRERAYEMWLAAGMEDGFADAHWVCAEQAVKGEGVAHAAPKAAKAKTTKAAPARKSSKSKAA